MGLDISKIDAIVFDLGGVIIDLYEERTYQAFAALAEIPLEEMKRLAAKEEFFQLYEIGEIDDPTFRAHLRGLMEFKGVEPLIDEAWNAMLGPIPKERLELLEVLRDKFKLFVMSNTNEIHVKRFLRIANHVSPGKGFYEYFDKVYLSNEVGERKPNPGAWQVILDEQPIKASRTLFIDDKLENIQAAQALGLQVYHNVSPNDWMKLFS